MASETENNPLSPALPGPRRRVSLAAVARHAGVAASTASLAFSNAEPVAAPTRRRVLDAAADLGDDGPDPTAASRCEQDEAA